MSLTLEQLAQYGCAFKDLSMRIAPMEQAANDLLDGVPFKRLDITHQEIRKFMDDFRFYFQSELEDILQTLNAVIERQEEQAEGVTEDLRDARDLFEQVYQKQQALRMLFSSRFPPQRSRSRPSSRRVSAVSEVLPVERRALSVPPRRFPA